MADLSVTAGDVAPVKIIEQFTAPAGEAIAAGDAVRFDTSTGYFTGANGTTVAEARCVGIALVNAAANLPVTVLLDGYIDLGDALDALTYDDTVYLSDTDGTLADAAGTVDWIVGTVVPGFAATTADKLLRVKPGQVAPAADAA